MFVNYYMLAATSISFPRVGSPVSWKRYSHLCGTGYLESLSQAANDSWINNEYWKLSSEVLF